MQINQGILKNIITNFFSIYTDGFKSSNAARKLFFLILIKLFIIFIIFKIFFFPNFLNSKFSNDADKSNYVIKQLTNIK